MNSKKAPINAEAWLPAYTPTQKHIFILLTSLNLGGAEKIVSDQLWANYYQKYSHKVTLIVIYDKQKEHSIPPNVNVVRLNNNIKNGEILFRQIAYEKSPLVCHLINDTMSSYLFSLDVNIHLVIHNDKRGWVNTKETFNHPNLISLISLISVCRYVTSQLKQETDKPIFTVRHQINQNQYSFNQKHRDFYREKAGVKEGEIVIGMVGRICLQKNYFLALDVLKNLIRTNKNYKLVILGGFEKMHTNTYLDLLKKIACLELRNHVVLAGFQTNANEWLNAFDVGLNVSYYEGLSMATQEFMMNGLNMVLSDVSGQPEILDLQNQLHFFHFPEELKTTETNEYDITKNDTPDSYIHLIHEISKKIEGVLKTRVVDDIELSKSLSKVRYGSHNLWNLFHFIHKKEKTVEVNPLFVTSNLNLGGAQRSLVNLMSEMKKDGVNIPLAILNQSNYTGFYKKIIEEKIEHHLCHSHNDVFTIMADLLEYIEKTGINKIIFWNVDSKIKVLLSKLAGHFVDIIDVSPGDYCLVEMSDESLFQDAIYHPQEEYFKSLDTYVSKFYPQTKYDYESMLKRPIEVIQNGVLVPEDVKPRTAPDLDETFKFLVCGRITESKHIHVILEAFESLIKMSNSKIEMDFYGSVEPYNTDYFDALVEKYRHLIDAGQIRFKGNIDDPQTIMDEYHAIIVLGTHQGSPNVVLEALATCLPCIANDSGGTKEMVNDNTGLLLPSKPEVTPLLNGMVFVIENYSEMVLKSLEGKRLIDRDFSMGKMKEKYLKVIYG